MPDDINDTDGWIDWWAEISEDIGEEEFWGTDGFIAYMAQFVAEHTGVSDDEAEGLLMALHDNA